MYNYQDIRTIHLEITQKCQAACPMCDRNQNGGALNPHINLDELTLEDCKKIFTPKFISQLKKCICAVTWEIQLLLMTH